jgi:hypothetical protein
VKRLHTKESYFCKPINLNKRRDFVKLTTTPLSRIASRTVLYCKYVNYDVGLKHHEAGQAGKLIRRR